MKLRILLLSIFILCFIPNSLFAQSASFRFQDKAQEIKVSPDKSVIAFNESQKAYKNLTDKQKEFYYFTNYSRKNPKRFWDSVVAKVIAEFPEFKSSYSESLKKDLYSRDSLPLLYLNDSLIQMANWLSNDNMKSGAPSHTASNGKGFAERFGASGVITKCAGENISWGNLSPLFALISLYIDKDLPQLGHRKALLNPLYTQIGVGVSAGTNNSFFYVQDFACWPQ